jgi:hypothetical protein
MMVSGAPTIPSIGLIDYNGHIEGHNSLLSLLFADQSHDAAAPT